MKARFLFTAILALVTSAALAGEYRPAPVVVDLDLREASGDLWSARFSKGDVEFIGCGVRAIDDGAGGAFLYALCEGKDSDGNRAVCFALNPGLVEAVLGLGDFGFLTFAWDASFQCTDIKTIQASFNLHNRLSK